MGTITEAMLGKELLVFVADGRQLVGTLSRITWDDAILDLGGRTATIGLRSVLDVFRLP